MNKRPSKLPILVLTGASGIIGKHFIKAFRDDAYIYAIARHGSDIRPVGESDLWLIYQRTQHRKRNSMFSV